MSLKIIGITGPSGAGKGTIVEYLVEHHGFTHYSLREYLRKEIIRRGLVLDRESMEAVANDMRATHGPTYISEQLLKEIERNGVQAAVIESIRSVADAKNLKKHGAFIWAVDADVHERFKRVTARGTETDHISFEKFLVHEATENVPDDPTRAHLHGVVALADVLLTNAGSIKDLHAQVEQALERSGS